MEDIKKKKKSIKFRNLRGAFTGHQQYLQSIYTVSATTREGAHGLHRGWSISRLHYFWGWGGLLEPTPHKRDDWVLLRQAHT